MKVVMMSGVLVDLETGAALALEDAEAQELQHAAAEKGEPTPPTSRCRNCGSGWDTESGRSLCPRCRKDLGEAHLQDPLLSDRVDEAFEGGFLGELTAREKRDYTSEPSTPLSEPQTHERLLFPAPMPANECSNCGAGAELSWDTESGKTLCPRCHREAGEMDRDDGHSRTKRRKESRKSGPGTMRYKVYTMPKHQKTHE
ncbi:hypothetical protein Pelo_8203 [Pelomyxa schiedti]|nr:hypothetical protein Pelo_8203 [Pelomyxa schiedti]